MMKKAFTFLTLAGLCLCFAPGLFAQDSRKETEKESPWKFSGILGANASQTAMVNWAAGGNNNFLCNAVANLVLDYKQATFSWQTKLDTDFGKMYQENQVYNWRKSSDKLNLMSTAGWNIAPQWQAAFQASFKSQFTEGYEYTGEEKKYISNLLAPAYIDLSVGFNFKPGNKYNLFLSPAAGRITVVKEQELRSRYGVAEDKNALVTLGLGFTAGCNLDLAKDVKLISDLSLYTPYNSDFGNVDVDWTLNISYKFLKVFNISLQTALKYYDKVLIADAQGHKAPRVQFKEVVGLGLGYNF